MVRPIRLLVLLLLIAGCADMTRLDAVPADVKEGATVLGMSDIRYWGDEASTKLVDDALQSYQREVTLRQASGATGNMPPAEFLAISGGGENGAGGIEAVAGHEECLS